MGLAIHRKLLLGNAFAVIETPPINEIANSVRPLRIFEAISLDRNTLECTDDAYAIRLLQPLLAQRVIEKAYADSRNIPHLPLTAKGTIP